MVGGPAAGKGKAEEAARLGISSPLLETSIKGARGILINVTGSMDIGLEEVEQAASLVQAEVHPDAVTIFGATFDDTLEDEIRVTVIATGFEEKKPKESAAGSSAASGDSSKERFDNMFLKPKEEEKEESDPFDDILRIFSNAR